MPQILPQLSTGPVAPQLGQAADATPLVPSFGRPRTPRPLPDAVAVRRVTVPESGPPFDDRLPAGQQRGRPGPAAGGGVPPHSAGRALVTPGPGQITPGPALAPGSGGPRRSAGRQGPATHSQGSPARSSDPATSGAGPDRPAGGRPAVDWPGQFARVLAETLAGSRPARQITPWTTEQARRRIRQLGPLLSAGQPPQARRLMPAVRRVLTCCPAAGVLEMTVVLVFDGRVRALAVRLERDQRPGGPWVCTAVEAA
jgi:hypothetical protein